MDIVLRGRPLGSRAFLVTLDVHVNAFFQVFEGMLGCCVGNRKMGTSSAKTLRR